MEKLRYDSGTKWEPVVGYSRAVRVGNHIYVSGTTATNDEGEIVGKGNVYEQARQVLRNIEAGLKNVNASLSDVVRTRIYLTHIEDWKEVGKAHGQVFSEIRPATTIVEVSRLIDPEILVEIEAVAYAL
ncbi:MAG: RidA family protein [Bacteroidetes bacterium]|nr:RidA family protein [Bacteroidota bacterium]